MRFFFLYFLKIDNVFSSFGLPPFIADKIILYSNKDTRIGNDFDLMRLNSNQFQFYRWILIDTKLCRQSAMHFEDSIEIELQGQLPHFHVMAITTFLRHVI